MQVVIDILLFIIVFGVLVIVHELGHLIVAKIARIRVDEFGIGFPPRALTMGKIDNTEYTLNWVPLGGFVRLYGEEGEEGAADAFSSKPFFVQLLVLIAGIAMNIVLAWILFSITLAIGTQQELTQAQIPHVQDAHIVFDSVRPGSPADNAGFMAGDVIKNEEIITKTFGESYNGVDPAAFTSLIALDTFGAPMRFTVDRGGKTLYLTATPATSTVPGAPLRPGIGVAVSAVGTVKVPLKQAPVQGAELTWQVIKVIAVGFAGFFKGIFTLKPNLSDVMGPIGITVALGQVAATGFSALLFSVGAISVDLALLNLIPIPALDGGRILFALIEAARGKKIPSKIAERVNMIGLFLILVLAVVVSAHDVFMYLIK